MAPKKSTTKSNGTTPKTIRSRSASDNSKSIPKKAKSNSSSHAPKTITSKGKQKSRQAGTSNKNISKSSQEKKRSNVKPKQNIENKPTSKSQTSNQQSNLNKSKQTSKSKVVKPIANKPQISKTKTSTKNVSNKKAHNSTVANKFNKFINLQFTSNKHTKTRIYNEEKELKRQNIKSRKTMKLFTGFYFFSFILVIAMVLYLEIGHSRNGYDLLALADDSYVETSNLESTRGTIFDANGEALAINLQVYNMKAIVSPDFQCKEDDEYVNCAIDISSTEAGTNIANAMGLDSTAAKYISNQIQTGLDNGKYEVSFAEYGKNVTMSQKNSLDKLNYPWLSFEPQTLRFYPFGDFASYIVGYTIKDKYDNITGALGAEKALNGHLKGQDGSETASIDNYGIEISDAVKSVIPKIDGTDVYLTIDSVVQTYVENAMETTLASDEFKDLTYDGLFTIVMDVDTGDILAAQSYPSFDPNVREIENYTNYFTNYCYEPGSTFKTATIAAAYEEGVWNDNVTEPTGSRSASTWGGLTIRDWNNGVGWGNLTWRQGYYLSANTVMTYVMDAINADFWLDFVENKLLIGTPVTTQFFETPSCDFSPEYDVEYATTSFGQGMTVNALQMLRMYSALLNDGTMVTPHFVQSIKDSDTNEEIYTDEDLEVTEGVVSSETSAFVRDMLSQVVDYNNGTISGTAPRLADSEYDIGAKTGTAQVAGDNGKYIANQYIYSLISAAPIDDPQIIVYTVAIKPNGSALSNHGFPEYTKSIIENTLSYLNSENREVSSDEVTSTMIAADYSGMDMSDIKKSNLTVKIGTGAVTAQYPKAGQTIANDQKVIVFGTDDLTVPNMKGYTYNETVAVCNQLQITCEYKKSGAEVVSVSKQSESNYSLTMG